MKICIFFSVGFLEEASRKITPHLGLYLCPASLNKHVKYKEYKINVFRLLATVHVSLELSTLSNLHAVQTASRRLR